MGTLIRDCPHCGGAKMALKCHYAVQRAEEPLLWCAFFICPGCWHPLAGLLHNRERKSPMELLDLNSAGFIVFGLYPEVIALAAPLHAPESVSLRWIEAEKNFRQNNRISAAAMYRSALEIATKTVAEESEKKLKLIYRIDSLAQRHRITDAMKDWAHQVRVGGNDALHDEEIPTEAEVTQLRLFTEMTLKYLFELPGEVEARRAKSP